MSITDPVPVRGLRAALASSTLLGFDTNRWMETGTTGAKAAFVGHTTAQNEVVTTLVDDASNTGSLRYFLDHEVDGDSISFMPGLAGTINLGGTLNITKGVTIDGGNKINISGQNQYGVFQINNSTNAVGVTIKNLTIEDGNSTGNSPPAGFKASGSAAAGGIYLTNGPLILENDTFLNNTAKGGNGSNAGVSPGPFNSDKAAGKGGNAAGAVYVDPAGTTSVTASNLTFTGNTATAGKGGAGDAANPTPGADGTAYPISNSPAVENGTACYVGGTLIRTTRGDIAVEHLRLDDVAVTADGRLQPIRWLGHRKVDCRRHPRPHEALSIRIAAHAFGENRPARDLFVSPGHAICVDVLGETLIPAVVLVNGSTIQQVEVDEVTYWHVELDDHDIILAENLPAESYIDCGNRWFFEEADVVALGASPDARPATLSDYCRPFVGAGPVIEIARAQLRRRAVACGGAMEAPGNLDHVARV